MPLWSLTLERLDKLKQAIRNKKEEHDILEKKSEKDLWCEDLQELSDEWEAQLELEAQNATKIRRMGRRVSKKIGAGTGGRSKKAKDDDDYAPEKKPRAKAKAVPIKVEATSSQRFAEKFSAKPKPKKEPEEVPEPRVVELKDDDFSEDDFSALSRSKPAAKTSQISSVSQSQPKEVTTKRAAAPKSAKAFMIDSDSDGDDDMLGDVRDMVRGLGQTTSEDKGGPSAPTVKTKLSSKLDEGSPGNSNDDVLADAPPHKGASKAKTLVDDLLSDDDEPPAPAIKASVKAAVAAPGGVKKKGRPPAAPKAKTAEAPKPKPALKSSVLSPAAKAYAARKKSAQDESDDEMAEASSPPPRPAARGRPGRAAATRKPIIVDDESSMNATEEDEESDDPFEMDDD